MKTLTLAPILLLAFSSLAEAGSLFSTAPPDYGRAMSQSQCQALARRNVEPYLRNPRDARYSWGKCEAQTMAANIFKGIPKQSGYGMRFYVNSTNKWGKYTGATEYVILIHDGKVVRRMRAADLGGYEYY